MLGGCVECWSGWRDDELVSGRLAELVVCWVS